ncbi:sugar kinase [Tsuneonella mangrovi]|uniref:sugar kinase n=1 Tax=Tsuneonella mangrovi TaxID=1982042 RepID=UPI000BA24F78|nr:sugar kinase [Tsuneonella mangrovi]
MTLAAFGEVLLRLSPPNHELPFQSPELRTYVGGAEANVMCQLARLGHEARMISAVPPNALGDGVCGKLREQGVDTRHILRLHGRLGLYLVTGGAGARPSQVVYDRDATSFQQAKSDAWNWDEALAGVSWLHVSGINAALGEMAERSMLQAIETAKGRGVLIAFDCNYRRNLWEARGCDPVPILKTLISWADFLFGNHRDFALLAGKEFDGSGPERRRLAALCGFEMFPNLKGIASTARHVHEADRHTLSARIDRPQSEVQTEEIEITRIIDRIGSGDAFCAGVLDGLVHGCPDAETVRTGLALAALKHTLPGDASLFERADIDCYLSGHSDVRR